MGGRRGTLASSCDDEGEVADNRRKGQIVESTKISICLLKSSNLQSTGDMMGNGGLSL